MEIRPYSQADRAACLAVFDSNVPRFFAPGERGDFERFLEALATPYFVMEHDGAIVGCGGYALGAEAATLTWGLIQASLHRNGLGRFLLMYRLREIGKAGAAAVVRLSTSQHSAGFFEKQGFRAGAIEKDGYGAGLDRIEMARKIAVCGW